MTEHHYDLEPDRGVSELRPILLRDREAAGVLGVSVRTVFDWRENHGLPHVRIGRTVRYPLADLQRWAEARIEGGAA